MFFFKVARHVAETAAIVRDKLKIIGHDALLNIGGSVSIDCWTDKHRRTTFFGLTIHFIVEDENDLKLNDGILATRELHIEKKDGPYI